ncbi:ribosomal protein S18-alanine N-acetyltransferase [Hyalangium sp.]|uniref:ribosomal protein S18-alanine N-acetyltransferase n=1 Tax=Hyalangium sp. TaxID=2028555 RepID=UPI002D2544BE|nr:ribosomal protein S18-alanine N-acetyltransferase [Hyalangium sp.]HYH95998.1 ribosomal protein S18-alanine N-acetyltransferase [Hyalangium sp.]
MRQFRDAPQQASQHPFVIRQMTFEDMPAVIALEQASFRNPWSPELLRRELEHDWSTILLVEEPLPGGQKRLLGLAIFWIVQDEVHILNVATAPEHRRRGVGRAVMDELLARGRSRCCILATLEVRRSNEAAIGLYRSLGFRSVGVRPNYYVDEKEDALVMVLDF